MSLHTLLLPGLFILLAGACTPQVKIGKTTVTGSEIPSLQQDFFGGIPFAEPPLGELRFKPPVLKTTLNGDTFDASNFGLPCLQPFVPFNSSTEDCLTINIFRPSNATTSSSLPVLFWAYGGGFVGGSGSQFNASAIVARSITRGTPLIYVNFNYRLGPLGFPQGKEAAKRGALNLALKDQRAALQWVQKNIGLFGGDKDKVTVFGESAGSIMTAIQFLDPNFTKLARGGIFESGSAASPPTFTPARREISWQNFVRGVPECASLAESCDTFDCLRKANSSAVYAGFGNSMAKATELFPWDPVIDGPGGVFPEYPSKLFAVGQFAHLPFIAGTNLDEGTVFLNPSINYTPPYTHDQLIANFSPPVTSPKLLSQAADKLLQLYPDDPALGSPFGTGNETFNLAPGYKQYVAIYGDITFQAERRLWSQVAAKAGVKTYGYLFTQPQPTLDPSLGVTHSSEIAFVYGQPPAFNATESASKLSTMMMDYWISFAVTLDPNDGLGSNRPVWAQYTSDNPVLLQLNGDNTTLIPDNYRSKQIGYINSDPLLFLH